MSAAETILSPEAVTGAHGSSLQRVFGVIYADPPWRYDSGTVDPTRKIENHYPTMDIKDICAIQPPASKDCVLYMWATAPMLVEAMQVISAWGFRYKTHAIWDKQKIGIGFWFRGQHELLMVGVRGKVRAPEPEKRVPSVIRHPRGQHSAKPDQVRDLITGWFPGVPKLEMFARPWTEMWPKHDEWETWGNELPNDVAMTPNDQAQRPGGEGH